MTSRQLAYEARRKADGWRRVTVWLSDTDQLWLSDVTKATGYSEPESIRQAIRAFVGMTAGRSK